MQEHPRKVRTSLRGSLRRQGGICHRRDAWARVGAVLLFRCCSVELAAIVEDPSIFAYQAIRSTDDVQYLREHLRDR